MTENLVDVGEGVLGVVGQLLHVHPRIFIETYDVQPYGRIADPVRIATEAMFQKNPLNVNLV
ncbi:MAG: hypothetical protein VXX36_11740 [Verrucomicrobiota bacterium]|nr:hypothetical protein [Verrucomicrobiota bacterium]